MHSYAMLTINADDHALMRLFHKPTDEKRMVVILPEDSYQDWLEAPAEHSHSFMRPCQPVQSLCDAVVFGAVGSEDLSSCMPVLEGNARLRSGH